VPHPSDASCPAATVYVHCVPKKTFRSLTLASSQCVNSFNEYFHILQYKVLLGVTFVSYCVITHYMHVRRGHFCTDYILFWVAEIPPFPLFFEGLASHIFIYAVWHLCVLLCFTLQRAKSVFFTLSIVMMLAASVIFVLLCQKLWTPSITPYLRP